MYVYKYCAYLETLNSDEQKVISIHIPNILFSSKYVKFQ